MHFRREEIDSFHATDYEVDPRTGEILLRYALSGRSGGGVGAASTVIGFEERIDLGGPIELEDRQRQAFERIVRLLHAVAGTSYYKAAAPGVVSIDSGPLGSDEQRFVSDLYDKGLREFAHRNGLPVPHSVELRLESAQSSDVVDSGDSLEERLHGRPSPGIAVPIGGGKDSLVVVEALRDLRPVLVAVNPAPAPRRCSEAAGLDLVGLSRTLDPALLELNASGALNGHVPITAIVSLITVLAGYVHGYSATVMALENSADEPTRRVGSVEVNHQWSKSSECERELRAALASISPGVRCGSVMRDLSELEIAGCFAELTRFHSAFRSCNRAFSITNPLDGWCNDCPKCRFVYLTLATSLDPGQLTRIFGEDLLQRRDQVDGFRDLLEEDRKPFECVGTRSESIEAFARLARSDRWSEALVVSKLRPLVESIRAGSVGTEGSLLRRGPAEVLRLIRERAESIAGGLLEPATPSRPE